MDWVLDLEPKNPSQPHRRVVRNVLTNKLCSKTHQNRIHLDVLLEKPTSSNGILSVDDDEGEVSPPFLPDCPERVLCFLSVCMNLYIVYLFVCLCSLNDLRAFSISSLFIHIVFKFVYIVEVT